MKKVIALATTLIMALTLAACGGSDSNYFGKLIKLYEEHGVDAVHEEMRTAEFDKEFNAAMSGPSNQPAIYALQGETGCGFYLVDDDRYVYVGDYSDRQRSGRGVWLWVSKKSASTYVYDGSWVGDKPNGEGSIVSIIDESTINKVEGATYALVITITGTFKDGLEHGSNNWQWLMDDGHTHNWNVTADNGVLRDMHYSEYATAALCSSCGRGLSAEDDAYVWGFWE